MSKVREGFNPVVVYAPTSSTHGGACCGISHIYNFPEKFYNADAINYRDDRLRCIMNEAEAEARIRYLIEQYPRQRGKTPEKFNRLWEIVLTQEQRKTWGAVIEKIGFKPTLEFINSNTNHKLTVFHYQVGPRNADGPYSVPVPVTPKGIPDPFGNL